MSIRGPEIAELLRRIARGEATLQAVTKGGWGFCGDATFRVENYTLTIFNDCYELDYVDSAECDDGRRGCFDEWFEGDEEPVSLLTSEEANAVENALEATST